MVALHQFAHHQLSSSASDRCSKCFHSAVRLFTLRQHFVDRQNRCQHFTGSFPSKVSAGVCLPSLASTRPNWVCHFDYDRLTDLPMFHALYAFWKLTAFLSWHFVNLLIDVVKNTFAGPVTFGDVVSKCAYTMQRDRVAKMTLVVTHHRSTLFLSFSISILGCKSVTLSFSSSSRSRHCSDAGPDTCRPPVTHLSTPESHKSADVSVKSTSDLICRTKDTSANPFFFLPLSLLPSFDRNERPNSIRHESTVLPFSPIALSFPFQSSPGPSD